MQRFSLRSRTRKPNDPAESAEGFLILLAEDNPADVGLVREALQEHGVEGEILVAPDGDAAIQLMRDMDTRGDPCPDLLILDLNLPKRSGREVLESTVGLKCCRPRVVVLSSSDSKSDQDHASRFGVLRYLRKPSRLEEFIRIGAVLKDVLGSPRPAS